MRDYKFRGKRKDTGEWVTGYYWRMNDEKNGNKACITVSNVGADDFFNYEVLPETVGQFSGLLDVEGKEIFEDDIVLSKKHWKRPYSIRKQWKRFHGLVVCGISQEHGTNEWDVSIEGAKGYDHVFFGPFMDCKVISNIHDAPNLLNQPTGGALNMNTDPNVKPESREEVKAPTETEQEQVPAQDSEATEG